MKDIQLKPPISGSRGSYRRMTAWGLALCLLSTLTGGNAYAEKVPARCRYTNFGTFPVNFTELRPTIEGSVNGKPATMLIDTGAQGTALTRQEAEKHGLTLTHSDEYHFGAGGESAAYNVRVDDISFGKLHWHHANLSVIYDISKSLSYSALVGADILFQSDIEISLKAREIKFFEPKECDDAFLAYWDKNASDTHIEEISPEDHRQLMTVVVNGHQLRAMIDSGAPISVINLAAAAHAGVTPQSPGVIELGGGGGIGKHEQKTWLAPFESFSIGNESIKNPKIEMMDLYGSTQSDVNSASAAELLHDQPDMLLGADFLRSHHVLFALGQHRLYFSYLGGKVFGIDDD